MLNDVGALTADWARVQQGTEEANTAVRMELEIKKQEALNALSMLDA